MIPPCSRPEREVLASVAEGLRRHGYAVTVEELAARPSNEPWLAGYAGLAVVAALAVYAAPLVTVLLGVAAIVLHARESDGRALLRRHTCATANVVARSPVAARPELVVVAPAAAPAPRLAERTQRALVVALQAGMSAVAAGGAAAWVAEAETELPVAVAVGGGVAAGAVALLAIVLYGSGGTTPARSGTLEALVRLAPRLREHAVWLVASGGRRGGMAGMRALLEDHPETGGALWLNLEPGSGDEVCALSEEGTWRERRADRYLLGAAEEAGADVRPYRAAPTDATLLLARHRPALSLMIGERGEGLRIAAATALDALETRRR